MLLNVNRLSANLGDLNSWIKSRNAAQDGIAEEVMEDCAG
jgi:hypothetical protein